MNICKHILITGLPGCGKTTLIKSVAAEIHLPYSGFFTNEIRDSSRRVGFEIESFTGAKGILSHINFKSPNRVGKYGINVASFEKIAMPEMEKAQALRQLLIVDEIGKMELLSQNFRNSLERAFDSDLRIIATILMKPHPFCDKLKNSGNTRIVILNKSALNQAFRTIIAWVSGP